MGYSISVTESTSFLDLLIGKCAQHYSGQVVVVSRLQEFSILFAEGMLVSIGTNGMELDSAIQFAIRYCQLSAGEAIWDYVQRRIKYWTFGQILRGICNMRVADKESIYSAFSLHTVIIAEYINDSNFTIVSDRTSEFILNSEDKNWLTNIDVLRDMIIRRAEYWEKSSVKKQHSFALNRERFDSTIHTREELKILQSIDGQRDLFSVAYFLGYDPLRLVPLFKKWLDRDIIRFTSTKDQVCNNKELPHILVVDDSPIIQSMLKRYLCEDYNVTMVGSALEALNYITQDYHSVDLIITDIVMPDMSGLDFCRMVRRIERFKSIPVFILTSKGGVVDRLQGHFSGATKYLSKPITKEELLSAVREYV